MALSPGGGLVPPTMTQATSSLTPTAPNQAAQVNAQPSSGPGVGGAATAEAAQAQLPQAQQAAGMAASAPPPGAATGGGGQPGAAPPPAPPGAAPPQPQGGQPAPPPPQPGFQPNTQGSVMYAPGQGPITEQVPDMAQMAQQPVAAQPLGSAGQMIGGNNQAGQMELQANAGLLGSVMDRLSDSLRLKTAEAIINNHGKKMVSTEGPLQATSAGEGDYSALRTAPWTQNGADAWKDILPIGRHKSRSQGKTRFKQADFGGILQAADPFKSVALPSPTTAKPAALSSTQLLAEGADDTDESVDVSTKLSSFAQGFLQQCQRQGLQGTYLQQAVKQASRVSSRIATELSPLLKYAANPMAPPPGATPGGSATPPKPTAPAAPTAAPVKPPMAPTAGATAAPSQPVIPRMIQRPPEPAAPAAPAKPAMSAKPAAPAAVPGPPQPTYTPQQKADVAKLVQQRMAATDGKPVQIINKEHAPTRTQEDMHQLSRFYNPYHNWKQRGEMQPDGIEQAMLYGGRAAGAIGAVAGATAGTLATGGAGWAPVLSTIGNMPAGAAIAAAPVAAGGLLAAGGRTVLNSTGQTVKAVVKDPVGTVKTLGETYGPSVATTAGMQTASNALTGQDLLHGVPEAAAAGVVGKYTGTSTPVTIVAGQGLTHASDYVQGKMNDQAAQVGEQVGQQTAKQTTQKIMADAESKMGFAPGKGFIQDPKTGEFTIHPEAVPTMNAAAEERILQDQKLREDPAYRNYFVTQTISQDPAALEGAKKLGWVDPETNTVDADKMIAHLKAGPPVPPTGGDPAALAGAQGVAGDPGTPAATVSPVLQGAGGAQQKTPPAVADNGTGSIQEMLRKSNMGWMADMLQQMSPTALLFSAGGILSMLGGLMGGGGGMGALGGMALALGASGQADNMMGHLGKLMFGPAGDGTPAAGAAAPATTPATAPAGYPSYELPGLPAEPAVAPAPPSSPPQLPAGGPGGLATNPAGSPVTPGPTSALSGLATNPDGSPVTPGPAATPSRVLQPPAPTQAQQPAATPAAPTAATPKPAAPATAPAEQLAALRQGGLQSAESQQIFDSPELRSHALQLPDAQLQQLLQEAAQADPKLQSQLQGIKDNPGFSDQIAAALAMPVGQQSQIGPWPFSKTVPGMGLSPVQAAKFVRVAKS